MRVFHPLVAALPLKVTKTTPTGVTFDATSPDVSTVAPTIEMLTIAINDLREAVERSRPPDQTRDHRRGGEAAAGGRT